MPKIVINEIDKTTAGTTPYSNFAVVVPGFVNTNKTKDAEKVFDENGVYECSNQKDFVEKIGLVNPEVVIFDAVQTPPTVTKVFYLMGEEDTEETVLKNLQLPEGLDVENVETSNNDEELQKHSDFQAALANRTMYKAIPNISSTGGQIQPKGRLADTYYIYKKVENLVQNDLPEVANNDNDEPTIEFDASINMETGVLYCIIDEGNEGSTEGRNHPTWHHGNQMAYELLGLGYTVLYKKLDWEDVKFDDSTEDTTTGNQPSGQNTEPESETTDPKAVYVNKLGESDFWECLKDKAVYDFRYIVTGLIEHNKKANKQIIALADHIKENLDSESLESNGRGDCIALVDIDRKIYTGKSQGDAIEAINEETAPDANTGDNGYASTYAAIFAPTVTYSKLSMKVPSEYGTNATFPASFHYLACAAKSAENYNEWYANAGYTRGVSKYVVESTGIKLGEAAIQALEPRKEQGGCKVAVNLIVKIKNNYYIWGNRTAKLLAGSDDENKDLVASHFLNIRQLCTTIKKQVYIACRRFTFDPNSDVLWINFCNALKPTLDRMKSDQGIRDYKIIKVKSTRRGMLQAKLRIVPIEAVEDFYINMYLEDSISGTDVESDEAAE